CARPFSQYRIHRHAAGDPRPVPVFHASRDRKPAPRRLQCRLHAVGGCSHALCHAVLERRGPLLLSAITGETHWHCPPMALISTWRDSPTRRCSASAISCSTSSTMAV